LKEELLVDVANFKAGRLKYFWENWRKFTSDPWIFQTLRGADIELASFPWQNVKPKQIEFTAAEAAFVENELAKLLAKQIVVECSRSPGDFISNIFLRPKKDGSHRVILNLKRLNEELYYHHFKMESLNSALNLLRLGCFMCSIDLKDAYYTVPIDQKYVKYLKFEYGGKIYKFTCMPNGLSSAPRIFTMLSKPVFSYLRKQGFHNTVYIDDSLLIGYSLSDCQRNVKATVDAVRHAGFIIHPEKSVFNPTQDIQYLGFMICSTDMKVRLTKDKASEIKQRCLKLLSKQTPTIQEVAEVVGKMVAALPGVKNGDMHYRLLDIDKIAALKIAKGNFDARMNISTGAKSDLKWWIKNVEISQKPISCGNPDIILQSDASNSGWGGNVLHNQRLTGGHWSWHENDLHINVKELLAAKFVLQSYCKSVTNVHVQIQVDNTTTAAYINKQGGKKASCNRVAREMWTWAIDRNIHLSTSYILCALNVSADTASRVLHDNMEWQLDRAVFRSLISIWQCPEIDLFASRLNHMVHRYVSWQPDPKAFAIDAFSISW
jgi:hypothetical protein